MERMPPGRKQQRSQPSEMDQTGRNKVPKVEAPVIALPGKGSQQQAATFSEALRDTRLSLQLLNEPMLPVGSNVAPPSSILGPTQLDRRGSLDSTDRNCSSSTADLLPAGGSAARVGDFGAFRSNAGQPYLSDDAGDIMQFGTGLGVGVGMAPTAAAARLAAVEASGDITGVYEALENLSPEQQQQVHAEVAVLQEMKLCRVVPGGEVPHRRRERGHSSLECTAFVVFRRSVGPLGAYSDEAAAELLATRQPVHSSLGPRFTSAFAVRKAECQQTGGEQQLLVVKCVQRFLMHPSLKKPQRQLLYTKDAAAMNSGSKDTKGWPEEDPDKRKQAVDLLVAAAVQVALGSEPDVPPEMLLFSIKAQPRRAAAATSTFNVQMQKLLAN